MPSVLTPRQREWLEKQVGQQKRLPIPPAYNSNKSVLVVDYKGDTAGLGAFLIVEDRYGEEHEVYVKYPRALVS